MYRRQSLYKIYLVLVLILVIITGATLYVVHASTTEMISGLTVNQAEAANRALANYIVELQDKSLERAQIIAGNEAVANSIKQGDYADLAKTIANLGEGMDFVTVCDTNGIVLARSHSEIVGDDLSAHSAIAAIFRRGEDEGKIEDIPTLGPSIRASSVVYSDNRFIGIIACGFRLTNYALLDDFKAKNTCEASIFYDDMRINTTVRDENGRRIVGRTVDARITEQVINNATPFNGQQTLFGTIYRAHYSPITIDKQVVGMLFTGVDISATLEQQRQLQYLIVVIITAALAASGVFLLATSRFNRMISSAMVELSDKTASLNMLENVLDGLDIFLYITDSQTDKLLFVNNALLKHMNLQEDIIGEYCYNVFQTGYKKRCPHCSLHRLEQGSDEFVIWEGSNSITGRYYRNIDRLIDWPDGKVAHFCQRIDMTDTKQAMAETDFVLQDMLEQLTEVMEGKMKQKQQHFAVNVSKDMPAAIVADRHKLTQVIMDLLDNAHKFTQEGGNIALYCMKTADDGQRCKLLIEVEDDGAEITEERQTVARDIVHSMGGEIWAEARPDKGSVISFTIEVGIGISAANL